VDKDLASSLLAHELAAGLPEETRAIIEGRAGTRIVSAQAASTASRPTARPAAAASVLLAVNGTLMRGLKLNPNMLAAGATFVREADTEAAYRLWTINDDHPAMIRVTDGSGVAVRLEAQLRRSGGNLIMKVFSIQVLAELAPADLPFWRQVLCARIQGSAAGRSRRAGRHLDLQLRRPARHGACPCLGLRAHRVADHADGLGKRPVQRRRRAGHEVSHSAPVGALPCGPAPINRLVP